MNAPGRVLRIAAAVILDAGGRMLVVRKSGTDAFMQPGGKLEPGESGAACLVRELEEELALSVPEHALEPLGRFSAPAANEAGWSVDCDVFRAPGGAITVQAELAEARWASRAELLGLAAAGRLAPLTRDNLDAFLAR
ncbi:MAG: NUDIX domain-containing protein [Microbacterium sp.]|nr:NUDIX domain-containing protein [Microbacterium sp.]